MNYTEHERRIAELNDELRIHHRGGSVLVTRGVRELGTDVAAEVVRAVADYECPACATSLPCERRFGLLRVGDYPVVFQIDYYAPDLMLSSLDPADASITHRFLTIMLFKEY